MANPTTAKAFQALGDPTRRELFERLAKRPLAVGELSEGLAVSRPAVSQHLKVLKDAGLVLVEQRGTRRLYQVDPQGVQTMRDYLDGFWDKSLAAFKAYAEKNKTTEKKP
ncbi:MAG TPA: metalloregulator ArsR/SmtB family transcription factor [bacterium]|nr:metalloregulator ArsR/SmtB family transcription factor [bacterium]